MYQAGRGVRAPPCCGCIELRSAVKVCGIAKCVVHILCCGLAAFLLYKSVVMLNSERKSGSGNTHADNLGKESSGAECIIFCSIFLVIEVTGIILSILHITSVFNKPHVKFLTKISLSMTSVAFSNMAITTIGSFYCRDFGLIMLATTFVTAILSCYTSWIAYRYTQEQEGEIINDVEGRVGFGPGGGPGRLYT